MFDGFGAGLFDDDPERTFGCEDVFRCNFLTPYVVSIPDFGGLGIRGAQNSWLSWQDDTFSNREGLTPLTDLGTSSLEVFAVWSPDAGAPIPEPNTALLLSLGLTGLAAKGRRSLRS